MKKWLNSSKILGILLSLPAIAFATHTPKNSHQHTTARNFNGIFIGLAAGASEMQSRMYIKALKDADDGGLYNPVTSINKSRLSNQAIMGELKLGIGHQFSTHFFTGLFGFLDLNYNHLQSEDSFYSRVNANALAHNLQSAKIKFKRLSEGLALQPGFLLTSHTLLYGLIGWDRATLKSSSLYNLRIAGNFVGKITKNSSQAVNGLQLGIGIWQQVYNDIALGLAYRVTDFSHAGLFVSGRGTGTDPGNFSYELNNIHIVDKQLLVDLTYWLSGNHKSISLPNISPQYFNGLYIKLGIGLVDPSITGHNTQQSNIASGVNRQITDRTITLPTDIATTATSLIMGEGYMLGNHVYIAGEAFVHWVNHTIQSSSSQTISIARNFRSNDTFSQKIRVKMHNVEPGVSVKLGLLVCRRILGYLRTGFVINKINLSQQSSFTYIDNFDTQATVNSSGKTHNHTSIYLMLGAGFEFEFTPHTTLSLDDTYTIYNSRTLNNTASIIDGNVDTATLTNSIKLHTAMNTIMIGLNHYF